MPDNSSEPRYKIEATLGEGGSGKVCKAWDRSLQRHVAIKRFHATHDIHKSVDERAWNEAMTLASIQHPNITTIYDFGIDADGPFVVMELLDGETLDKIVPRGVFQAGPFRQLALQTMEGLTAAHHVNLIHRDLKPQNIMEIHLASGAAQYKILDFGLAKFVSKPTSQTIDENRGIYGSAYYMAPEQLARRPVDARADLYAMGCVCYYVLTGKNAFEGGSIAEIITGHIQHRFVPLARRRQDLPQPIVEWVTKLMAFRPEERFASAADALAALHKIGSTKTVRLAKTTHPGVATDKAPAVEGFSLPEKIPESLPAKKKKWNPLPSLISICVLVVVGFVIGRVRLSHSPKLPPPPITIVQKGMVRVGETPATPAAPAAAPAPVATPAPAAIPAPEPVRPVEAPKPAAAAKPVTAKPAPAPAPDVAYAGPAVNPWATPEIIPAEAVDTLRAKVGQTVAVKGRIAAVRPKGSIVYVDFSANRSAAASIAFELLPAEKAGAAAKVRGYKNQIVCAVGVLQSNDGVLEVHATDLRQLDATPPL